MGRGKSKRIAAFESLHAQGLAGMAACEQHRIPLDPPSRAKGEENAIPFVTKGVDAQHREDVVGAQHRRDATVHGFTIIELMITLAVAAILTMLAMPSFKHLMISTNLSGVNNDLTGAMQFARTEAVSRQTAIAVAASAGNWQNGWTVQIAPAGTVLRTYAAVAPQYVVNGNAVTKVTFQPQGSLAPPSGSTAAVAATCITISSAGFGSSRFLQVLPAGMVQQTTSATAPTGSTCAAPTP